MTLETYSEKVFEGTLADIMASVQEMPRGQMARLIITEKSVRKIDIQKIDDIRGKYSHVPGGSEAYALHKQEELSRDSTS